MDRFVHKLIMVALGVDQQSILHRPFNDGRVIRIGAQYTSPVNMPVRIADHLKQRQICRFAIYLPTGVKYLVPTMFGVSLRKHHQFHVGGCAAKACK